jgi:cell division septation protein DedD
MFNFVFDKKSLALMLAGLTVAGGLLFFAGLLVGVNLGLPGVHQAVYTPRPLPARNEPPAARPCPEPIAPVETPAPQPAAPAPSPEPVQIAEAEAPPPAPVEKPARPRAVQAALRQESSGAFSVQVGAFSQKENSDAVMRKLESRGYQPYVVEMPGRRARLQTVRIGRYADREEALRAASEFRQRENMSAIVQRIDRL